MFNETIELSCRDCGHATRKAVVWLKAVEALICKACGRTMAEERAMAVCGFRGFSGRVGECPGGADRRDASAETPAAARLMAPSRA